MCGIVGIAGTRDVADDALAVERSPVTVKDGWAQRFRDMKARAKQK